MTVNTVGNIVRALYNVIMNDIAHLSSVAVVISIPFVGKPEQTTTVWQDSMSFIMDPLKLQLVTSAKPSTSLSAICKATSTTAAEGARCPVKLPCMAHKLLSFGPLSP